MALDSAPLLSRRMNLAFALETTNGTPATLGASAGVTPVYNPRMPFSTEAVERQSNGNLSPFVQNMGARPGTCTFSTDVVGDTSDAIAPWTDLLKGCGMVAASGVFTPTSVPTQTITFGLYQDGRLKVLAGCMGTFVIRGRRGQKAMIDWTFRGIQQPLTDTALITPTYQKVDPPRIGAVSIGGTSTYRIPELVFDAGNNVILREDLAGVDSAGNPTGYRSAYITGRNPRVRMSPEAKLVGTKDWFGIGKAYTTQAISVAVGAGANNTMTLAIPKAQLISDPQEEDRDQMLVEALEFLATRNTDLGDDEYSLTFS